MKTTARKERSKREGEGGRSRMEREQGGRRGGGRARGTERDTSLVAQEQELKQGQRSDAIQLSKKKERNLRIFET